MGSRWTEVNNVLPKSWLWSISISLPLSCSLIPQHYYLIFTDIFFYLGSSGWLQEEMNKKIFATRTRKSGQVRKQPHMVKLQKEEINGGGVMSCSFKTPSWKPTGVSSCTHFSNHSDQTSQHRCCCHVAGLLRSACMQGGIHVCGGGFFLACKDLGGRFDKSFPASFFFFL